MKSILIEVRSCLPNYGALSLYSRENQGGGISFAVAGDFKKTIQRAKELTAETEVIIEQSRKGLKESRSTLSNFRQAIEKSRALLKKLKQ